MCVRYSHTLPGDLHPRPHVGQRAWGPAAGFGGSVSGQILTGHRPTASHRCSCPTIFLWFSWQHPRCQADRSSGVQPSYLTASCRCPHYSLAHGWPSPTWASSFGICTWDLWSLRMDSFSITECLPQRELPVLKKMWCHRGRTTACLLSDQWHLSEEGDALPALRKGQRAPQTGVHAGRKVALLGEPEFEQMPVAGPCVERRAALNRFEV